MKKLKLILVCAIVSVLAFGMSACSSSCSEKYNLIYDTRGGSAINGQQLSAGAKIKRPRNNPTKEYFVFDDWYADKACTEPFIFETPMPANDVTVYAGWKDAETSVAITLNANGGAFADGSKTAVNVGVVGSTFAQPETQPQFTGYTFGGWYLEPECTTAYTFTSYPTENLTLYALWNKNSSYAYVSYYGNGHLLRVVPIEKGANITEENLFDEYTQTSGWFTDAQLTNAYTFGSAAANDVSLYTNYYTKGLTIVNGVVTAYNGASTEVTVPAIFNGVPVTRIGKQAFYRSTEIAGIQTVNLPDTVTTISEGAFYECRYLVSINLSGSVTEVGKQAFFGNERLKTFGDISSLSEIADETFLGCKALSEVTLSGLTKSVGAQAFADCTLLKSITVLSSTPVTFGSDAFDRCNALTIYVPSSLLQNYKTGNVAIGNLFAAIND